MVRSCTIIISLFIFFGCSSQTKETTPLATIEDEMVTNSESSIKIDSLTKNYDLAYVMGKFDPSKHPDFIAIESQFADREGMFMHRSAYEAFKKMYAAAKADSVQLVIRSAARNFEYQKGIWERKWMGITKIENGEDLSKTTPDTVERALKILRYSSMPSTSRHHWGTDIDLNAFNNSYFEKGIGKKVYDWLVANAPQYGFCQPYTPKGAERPNGYNEEKWHWSYLPVALPLTDLAKQQFKSEMVKGFKGAEAAKTIDVVQKYVLGINEVCK